MPAGRPREHAPWFRPANVTTRGELEIPEEGDYLRACSWLLSAGHSGFAWLWLFSNKRARLLSHEQVLQSDRLREVAAAQMKGDGDESQEPFDALRPGDEVVPRALQAARLVRVAASEKTKRIRLPRELETLLDFYSEADRQVVLVLHERQFIEIWNKKFFQDTFFGLAEYDEEQSK